MVTAKTYGGRAIRITVGITALVLLLAGGAGATSNPENFIITIGEDKVFTDFNYHDSWFENDPNNPEPWPDQREAYSEGNIAQVSLTATPGHAGVAKALTGVQFQWDLGKYTMEDVQNLPLNVTIDFSYEISASRVDGFGSANAGVSVPYFNENWVDFVGRENGLTGNSGTFKHTWSTTVKGLEDLNRKIYADVYTQAHSVSPVCDEYGNCVSYIHYSSAKVTVNSIKVEWKVPVILVHGWGGKSKDTWDKSMFIDAGFTVEIFDYDYRQNITTSAKMLKITIEAVKKKYRSSKVDIVAYSEGGLVSREYINSSLYKNDVRKLIMIGTPNHGLDIKGYGYIGGLIGGLLTDLVVGTAGYQMEPHSPFLKSLNGNDNCADLQSGTDKLNPSVQYYTLTAHTPFPTISHRHFKIFNFDFIKINFTTDGDGVVADNSLRLTGKPFYRNDSAGWHRGEGKSRIIIDKVISYLREDAPSMVAGVTTSSMGNAYVTSDIEPIPDVAAQWSPPIQGVIKSDEVKTHTVIIDNATKKAYFDLFWQESNLDLILYSPSGLRINSSVALGDPKINYTQETMFESYAIQDPEPGNWTMEINAINVTNPEENYSVITFMETNLFVGVGTNKSVYNPNETITVVAYVQDAGAPLKGVNVTATISKPNGINNTIQLYDDGLHNDNQSADGIYANTYTDTSVSGIYYITIFANGTKESKPFERQAFTNVWAEQYPDLTLTSSDIYFSISSPLPGKNITINATVHNIGDADANNASILFYDGEPANDELIAEDIINVGAGQTARASISWNATEGKHEIYVLISPFNEFLEKDYTNNNASNVINVTPITTLTPSLVFAITPNSRNAQVGTPVTIFMSVINGGTATATGVSITQASSLPATVSYQQWNGATLIGSPNTAVDIPAGGTANFVLTINATSAFNSSSLTFNVSGTNAAAASISGVNTLTISASTTPLPDLIMMATGTLDYRTGVGNATAFAVATSNIGATATGVSFNVVVPSSITGLVTQVNQTNPTTGAIIGPASGLTINVGATPTFAVFLTPTTPIAYDPTNNRITLQLVDDTGKVIGAQSVAISTT